MTLAQKRLRPAARALPTMVAVGAAQQTPVRAAPVRAPKQGAAHRIGCGSPATAQALDPARPEASTSVAHAVLQEIALRVASAWVSLPQARSVRGHATTIVDVPTDTLAWRRAGADAFADPAPTHVNRLPLKLLPSTLTQAEATLMLEPRPISAEQAMLLSAAVAVAAPSQVHTRIRHPSLRSCLELRHSHSCEHGESATNPFSSYACFPSPPS